MPAGPAVPDGLADVTTTLDFGDPPLSGRLRIAPGEEASPLLYAVDLDGDGFADETGPLGLGVSLSYLYEAPGLHDIGIALRAGEEWFRDDRIVVVNDSGAIRVADSARYFDELAGDFSGIAFDEARDRLFVATGGSDRRDILVLRSTDLRILGRLSLRTTVPGDVTALAFSPARGILYVDVGDSIVSVSVDGDPRRLGVVGPGDLGESLILGNDGFLYSGGSGGIARIDPSAGRVLARRHAPLGGQFSLSPEEDWIAFLESSHLCRLSLLEARDLGSVWTVENLVPEPCLLVAFSPLEEVLYVLAGVDGWLLVVVDAGTGGVLGRITLAEEDRGTRFPGVSSGSAIVEEDRFVAFSTERGVLLIDPRTRLPAYALRAIADDRAIGCCNVAPTSRGFHTTGWNLVTRLSLAP